MNDKNSLEKVQQCAARYVKGIYTYDASATQILHELQWESLESRRDQSRLIMLYNILKLNIFPSFTYMYHNINYKLHLATCFD